MTDNLPVPRSTLEDMERNRARAIDLYGQAFDMLAEARKYGSLAACLKKEVYLNDRMREFIAPSEYVDTFHFNKKVNVRELFISEITKQTDKSIWEYVIKSTDLERLMDHQARDELRASLEKDTPPATVDNIRATLDRFLEDSQTILQRGIVNAFCNLDRRFRSHDGFKIGGRVILDRAFDGSHWDYNNRKEEVLHDIERAFYVLDGKENPPISGGIFRKIYDDHSLTWCIEGDYFRLRRFQNGNAHLWFTRDDLVRKINRMLADYYGEVIGEGSDVADTSAMGPTYHVTPAKNFGLFESPSSVVEAVFDKIGYHQGKSFLEPSAGRGNLAVEARRRGGIVTCVEIQSELCVTLQEKSLDVKQGDFLKMTPADLGRFDFIVMNPPFDRGRDCDHVRHALNFLTPGGVLVSVMSASSQVAETERASSFRALIDKIDPPDKWRDSRWTDLPSGSFKDSGTMVNTCILCVKKPR